MKHLRTWLWTALVLIGYAYTCDAQTIRIYTITADATDFAGNQSVLGGQCVVPHNQ